MSGDPRWWIADHVHLVCSLGRTLSVAEFVAKLKVSSNKALRERHLSQFSWQNGYAAFSLAESTLEAVTEYVSNQEAQHKGLTFQEEYRAFLKRHHVPFDELLCSGLSGAFLFLPPLQG
jgi:hypothetical protein